jgi:hypothetical protein
MRSQGFDAGLGRGRAWWNGAVTLWEIGVVMPQIMALRTAQLVTCLSTSAAGPAAQKAASMMAAWQALATQGLQVQQHVAEQVLTQGWQVWLDALAAADAEQRRPFRATVVPVSGARARPAGGEQARTVSGEVLPPEATATNVRRLTARKTPG